MKYFSIKTIFPFVFFLFMFILTVSAQAAETIIYCIGDSITWGQAFGSGHDYPRLLNTLFAERGVEGISFKNKGVSGDTVGDRLDYWSGTSGERLLSRSDVHYVTIMLGTNDTRIGDETPTDVYLERMNALIDVFENHTNTDGSKPQVVLSLIPPHNSPSEGEQMASQFKDRFVNRDRIEEVLNPELLKIAEKRNLFVVDCYTPLKLAGPDILPDGLHPAREGNEILAQAFFDVFYPLLTQTTAIRFYPFFE